MTDKRRVIVKRLPDEIHPTHEGITSESKPDYVKDEIPMMIIFEVQCESCCDELRLKDFSTDGDGLVYQCFKCNREVFYTEIKRLVNGGWKTAGMRIGQEKYYDASPIDATRLGF